MSNELTQEERAELIKFGCKYADGFEVVKAYYPDSHRLQNCFTKENVRFDVDDFYMYSVARDFLQQVIEEINQESKIRFYIDQTINGIHLQDISSPIDTDFLFDDFLSIDQAKEQALFYIMNQEEENGAI